MKLRYIIGFFAAFFAVVFFLAVGYQLSYDHVTAQIEADNLERTERKSIAAEGQAVQDEADGDEGYYLCELNGYVVVYLSDKKTIYELTEIPVHELPAEVQNEVAEGRYAADEEELYAFLQNYSS